MYLADWMIVAIVASFGLCAVINYNIGRKLGILVGGRSMLEVLDEMKIIKISEEGVISRFSEPPKQKKRKTS